MEHLEQHIESLIFASEHPISLEEIKLCLETVFEQKIEEEILLSAIDNLKNKYLAESFAIEVVDVAQGFQFLSKGDYFQTIATHLKITTKKRLSRAAMETLAIIAYKQPVSKSSMEKIRGVSCDYSVQKLLEKELITIVGRSDGPGRPLLYGTSAKFMDYMGVKDVSELPKLKDFKMPDNEIGEAAPLEENTDLADPSSAAPADDVPQAEAGNTDPEQQNSIAVVENLEAIVDRQAIESLEVTDNAQQENREAADSKAEAEARQDENAAQAEVETPDVDQAKDVAIFPKNQKKKDLKEEE